MAITILILLLASALSLTSALIVQSAKAPTLQPGESGIIDIEIENNLETDAKEISLILILDNLPFTPIGSSEESVNEIEKDDEEDFVFKIKAANDITPGDYQIPYKLFFTIKDQPQIRQGAIGITVKADPDLSFSITAENPILNQQDKITLKIINKGFADAKFVALKIIPNGYTLLSENDIYLGTIDSDDFETATFDVVYNNLNPTFSAIIEYKDFDNAIKKDTISLPITTYTEKKALELGLIKKNNIPLYIALIIMLILLYIFYRTVRKAISKSRRKKLESG